MTPAAAKDRRLDISLRPWEAGDLPLLMRLLGDPDMMRHLGGPESADAISARHERYVALDPAVGGVFAIIAGLDAEAVGWVGYWESEWHDEPTWECGWHVLPGWQRRGVATAATALMLERVRQHGRHRHIHAFPSTDNAASNALSRTLGFESLGEVSVEYPLGTMMRAHAWRLDLHSLQDRSGVRTTGDASAALR